MRSIIEELFYGNICPSTDYRNTNEESNLLMKYISDHHATLNQTLTDEQQELFEKFNDCNTELSDINEREIFVYAFRLGMKIAVDALWNNTDET